MSDGALMPSEKGIRQRSFFYPFPAPTRLPMLMALSLVKNNAMRNSIEFAFECYRHSGQARLSRVRKSNGGDKGSNFT